MFGTLIILALTIAFFVAFRVLKLKYLLSKEDDFSMSTGNLRNGNFFPFVTATLMHVNLEHIVHNMAMIMPVSLEIEERLGAVNYVICYFFVGACGLIGTVAAIYLSHKKSDMLDVMDMATSQGASPATYGIIYFLAAHSPSCYVGKLMFPGGASFWVLFYCFATSYWHNICCLLQVARSNLFTASNALCCWQVSDVC